MTRHPSKLTLTQLPQDVLYQILLRLSADNVSLEPLSSTCKSLRALIHPLTTGGVYAVPLTLPFPDPLPYGLSVTRSRGSLITVSKSHHPGDAYLVFPRDVSQTSATWTFRLRRFKGNRITVGVATPDAFRFGTVERLSSWSFDCFGRACIAGCNRTYGRQMRCGDTVTVLYDASQRTLSFLDNGVSMGALPIHIRATSQRSPTHEPLLPFVYFPFVEGEAISLQVAQPKLVEMAPIHQSVARWKRPTDLPYDGCIIVGTWEDKLWYPIRVNPRTTTLTALWTELQSRHGMAMHLFELIYKKKRLPNRPDLTLADVGILIDPATGTCNTDILLSVPHIVS